MQPLRPIAMAIATLAFCVIALSQSTGSLADSAPLDLRACVQYALDHAPDILSRKATLATAEATFAKDHAAEYPSVTGLLQNQAQRQSNSASSLPQYGLTPASTYSVNTAQISTQWTISTGSSYQLTAEQAKRRVQGRRDDLLRAEQQIAQTVAANYFSIATRRQAIEFDAADLAYQRSLLDVATNQERVGRVAGVDVLRARVNELRSRATLATAQADEQTAQETLAQSIGAPPDQQFLLSEDIPEPAAPALTLPALIAIAQLHRADLASALADLRVAQLADGVIDSDRYPTIVLSGAFGHQHSLSQFTSSSAGVQNLLPGFTAGPPNTAGFWSFGVTETLQFPFIEYGARRAAHREAFAERQAAEATFTTVRDAVIADVARAVRLLQTSAANLTTAKEASVLARESVRITQLQYKNGLVTLTDGTQAERDNLSAQSDLAAAQAAYVGAIVRLRVALGDQDPREIVTL